jgi:ribosome-binding factor A
MQSRRHQRVRELLKRAIGEVIRREIPIPEAGLVSVNDVGLSGDMHSATVFVSILGGEALQTKGLALLNQHQKRIQEQVGHSVVLKYTPHLRFSFDDSIARGNRVLGIIEELEKSDPTA